MWWFSPPPLLLPSCWKECHYIRPTRCPISCSNDNMLQTSSLILQQDVVYFYRDHQTYISVCTHISVLMCVNRTAVNSGTWCLMCAGVPAASYLRVFLSPRAASFLWEWISHCFIKVSSLSVSLETTLFLCRGFWPLGGRPKRRGDSAIHNQEKGGKKVCATYLKKIRTRMM